LVQTATTAAKTITETAGAELDKLKEAMLEVVSEKTGYPKEMLDLNTDLESGLGIDSIKRVEILSALQEKMPLLKDIDTTQLATLQTLQQILDNAIGIGKPAGGAAPADAEQGQSPASAPAADQKKKTSTIFRHPVKYKVSPASGLAIAGLKSANPLYMVEDNLGVAPILEKMLNELKINTLLIKKIPTNAKAVIFLKGIDSLPKEEPVKGAVELSKEAFETARACGAGILKEGGIFVTVQDVCGNFPDDRVWSGGLGALAKTAAIEWPNAAVRAIDIECKGRSPESIAKSLFNELIAGGPERETLLKADGTRMGYATPQTDVTPDPNSIAEGSVVVVSGGARGVTAECLKALADKVKVKIAILARTPLKEEPTHLTVCETDADLKKTILKDKMDKGIKVSPVELNKEVKGILAGREVRKNISEMKQKGSEVKYYSVNVCDFEDVCEKLEAVREEWGGIKILVHAAGVLADKRIHEKTDEQFDMVFTTKVKGFQNLLNATADDDLSHICCFSSIVARTGNIGQVDYSMANDTLNKVCQYEKNRRKGKCVVKSINWGPWAGGMVKPELKTHFESMGITLIPLDEGAEAFVDEMMDSTNDPVEVVIGGRMDNWVKNPERTERCDVLVNERIQPFIKDHSLKGAPVLPAMFATELLLRTAKAVYPSKEIRSCKDLKVLKGIVLQPEKFNGEGEWFTIGYDERDEEGSLLLDMHINSIDGARHYSGSVELTDASNRPTPRPPSTNANLEKWELSPEIIYRDRLFHQKGFQVIRKTEGFSDNGCSAVLKNKEGSLDGNDSSWVSDTAIFDGGLQLSGLWFSLKKDSDTLPMEFKELELYRHSIYTGDVHCEIQLLESDKFKSRWDVIFTDQNNEPLAVMRNLTIQRTLDPGIYGLLNARNAKKAK
jgi:NAD(P)-dependent dehydrogenase (short-subunit alcohol dehydrogenase family)/acyl carrier protein